MSQGGEGAPEGGAAEGNEPKAQVQDNKIIINGEEFDPERALNTIRAQREAENELKEKLRKYEAAEQEELDKQKTLEERLAERNARIQELEKQLAARDAAADFKAQAEEAGITDPELALLVAEREGLLGEFNPETGKIEGGKVDFGKLVERHPILAGEKQERKPTGDAGRLGGGKVLTPSERFNRAIRGQE